MYKKAQVATDTPILLSIFVFQAFVILSLGFLNVSYTKQTADTSLFNFGNIITSIAELGWGNTLLFAPIGLCVIYIIAKLIRGGG
jgi:hypothetical protein